MPDSAITDCRLCDPAGYRLPARVIVCDHQHRDTTNGRKQMRQVLAYIAARRSRLEDSAQEAQHRDDVVAKQRGERS